MSKKKNVVGNDWEVTDLRGVWMGRFWEKVGPIFESRYVRIMPTSHPWELAVDALLDFMDRLREGRVPRGVDDPDVLMDICTTAARRQR